MMMEMILNLVMSVGKDDREEAYRNLEHIGIDRATADVMEAEFYMAQGVTMNA